MDSQLGLMNMWAQGDIVTRGVALLLLGMSLASWMVIIVKALDLRRVSAQSRSTEAFWHSADFADGLSKFGTDPADNGSLAELVDAAEEHLEHIANDVSRSVTTLPNTGGDIA